MLIFACEVVMKVIPAINVGDVLTLKKPHPCGSCSFRVLRVGSDIKICCSQCQRVLTVERVKLEKMIKSISTIGEYNEQN